MAESGTWQDVVSRIFHGIPDLASPPEVQSCLREILDDPDLELFWWDWEAGCHVDVEGQATEDVDRPGRAITSVDYESRKVGLIVHDRRLLERPEFMDAFVPTMRIAMERDRLHRDLVVKLDQLRASRLRIVEATEEERRRLERNLHDGAQQRLVAARLLLVALERRAATDPDLAHLARQAREELDGGLADLRELALGLHPPLLAQQGLEAAVRAGCARSSVEIEADLRIDGGLSPMLEAAAYYVCSEAVTNVVKHASAGKVWLSVVQEPRWLTVEVRDDGVGGADPESGGTGLIGLRDRVEALDGIFDLSSPQGVGTTVVASFPLGDDR
jgi:signal transduction histidine kinase